MAEDSAHTPEPDQLDAEGKARRRLIKQAVYVPPVILGTIAVAMGACQGASCGPSNCPPGPNCNPNGCPPITQCPPQGGCGPQNCPPAP